MRSFLNHALSKNIIFHCLTPFFPLSHHGTLPSSTSFSSYTVICPKNLPSHLRVPIYRSHLLEIVNVFPDTTLCFTDGSKIGNRIGFTYSIGDQFLSLSCLHLNLISRTSCDLSVLETYSSSPNSPISNFLHFFRFSIRPDSRSQCPLHLSPRNTNSQYAYHLSLIHI